MKTKILLVDDHQMMRAGLRLLLARQPDLEVVGEASDGWTAVDLARTLSPDVVVMDVGLPEMNGIDATRAIRAENERVKVIALSAHSDRGCVHDMLEAGASGYVVKMSAWDELLRAVQAVRVGKSYLSPEIAGDVVVRSTHAPANGAPTVFSTLGPRETEVLQLVAEGCTSVEIAERKHISIKTVETHRRNIVAKLGLHGTAELTKYAIREGLTTLEAQGRAEAAAPLSCVRTSKEEED